MYNDNVMIKNLVFEGGGVKGISYLGMLDIMEQIGVLKNIKRVAGASAGAITASIVSLGLPFEYIKKYTDTLDYKRITQKKEHHLSKILPEHILQEIEGIFGGDIDCVLRLLHNYGWYSSSYFYEWLQGVFAEQFDSIKKAPPYTFADFKDSSIHKNNREFLDLHIIGTDMTSRATRTFCYETTPDMEVAEAVRISMSIPFFFESIKIDNKFNEASKQTHVYSDGGVVRNYPLNIFDSPVYGECFNEEGVNLETLGARFAPVDEEKPINNLINYIESLMQTLLKVQDELFRTSFKGKERSIIIDTSKVSATDFDITTGDDKYNYLYQQGVDATKTYFTNRNINA